MNGQYRKLLSLALALILVFSAIGSVSFSAAEAHRFIVTSDEENAPAKAHETQAQEDETQEGLAVVGAQPSDIAPEAASEAPTENPTVAPTQMPTEEPAPTVGKVRNISRDSYDSDRCLLNWDKVPGADGYYVYYLNADDHKNFSKFADVKTNSCNVKPLRQGTQYHFKVSAYIKYKGKIIEGEPTLKKTATQPSKVTGMTKWRSSDVLELEWDYNYRATGYRIYRTVGGVEKLYKTIRGARNTSFTDRNVTQGRFYKYRVKSFRELYDTSYSSDAGSIMFRAGLCGPDYSITSRLGRVNLTWYPNPYATHYEIYMSTTASNSGFVKQFTTPRLYYNTTKLTPGRTYYFRVRPIYVDRDGTVTGTSNKKSARVTTTAYGDYVGDTYIEISIDQQHMWAYKNGRQVESTEIVTGNKGDNDTPKGYYEILSKSTDIYLNGPGYSSFVNYWIAFIGSSYGIHDASWRSSFGNPIYKGNGSHGCVNTPYYAVQNIYYSIPTGSPVIIY